jgi:hypothetical protein
MKLWKNPKLSPWKNTGNKKKDDDTDEEELKLRATAVSRKEQRKKEAANEKARKKHKANTEYAQKKQKKPEEDPKYIQATAAKKFVRTKEQEQKFNIAKEVMNIAQQACIDTPMKKRCMSAALKKMLNMMDDKEETTPPPKEVSALKNDLELSPLSAVGPYQVRSAQAALEWGPQDLDNNGRDKATIIELPSSAEKESDDDKDKEEDMSQVQDFIKEYIEEDDSSDGTPVADV